MQKSNFMKKRMMLFVFALTAVSASFAQSYIEFVPSAGYTFTDRVGYNNTYGKIDGAANLGGSFVFNINRLIGFELMYNHISTNSGLYQYGSYNQGASEISNGNLNLDYIMLGPVQTFNIPNSPVRPFIGAMLGASVFTPGIYGNSSDVKFTWGLQMGTNVYITPRFGLRFKAQLLAPVDGTVGGFYAGTNASGQTVSTYPGDIYQFSLHGGLVIGLGRIMPELQPRRYINRGPRYRPHYPPYPYY